MVSEYCNEIFFGVFLVLNKRKFMFFSFSLKCIEDIITNSMKRALGWFILNIV